MTSWQQQQKNYTATVYACRCELQQWWLNKWWLMTVLWNVFIRKKIRTNTYACFTESTVIFTIHESIIAHWTCARVGVGGFRKSSFRNVIVYLSVDCTYCMTCVQILYTLRFPICRLFRFFFDINFMIFIVK